MAKFTPADHATLIRRYFKAGNDAGYQALVAVRLRRPRLPPAQRLSFAA